MIRRNVDDHVIPVDHLIKANRIDDAVVAEIAFQQTTRYGHAGHFLERRRQDFQGGDWNDARIAVVDEENLNWKKNQVY